MQETEIKIRRSWKTGYISLPAKYQRPLKRKIMEKLNLNYNGFLLRMYGRTFMTEMEVDVIREAFAEYGMDPFTGEKLN